MTQRSRTGLFAVLWVALGVWIGCTLASRARRPVRMVEPVRQSSAPAGDASAADSGRLELAPARVERAAGAIDVVLIVWDTVRRDELQPYGAKLPSSPFVASLARDGVTFANAYSTSSWTVPAMYSMMTGLYPREHGIVQSTIVGTDEPSQAVLPEEATTLAERLKLRGYSTFGVSTNFHLARQFGFAQGFDYFVGDGFHFRPFPRAALESLRGRILGSDKYFLWLHYFDPHFPYTEQEPWFQQWNDSPFANSEEVGLNAALSDYWRDRDRPPAAFVPPDDVVALTRYLDDYTFDPIRLYDALTRMTLGPDGVRARADYGRYLRAAYRSEIRAVDADVEYAFERLGIDDRTLVILTADHGEEFYDHGRLGHRLDSLYEELITVPLIVRFPGGAHRGTVVDAPVSLVDLLPSILEIAGGDTPENLAGSSFTNLLGDRTPPTERDLVAELTYLDGSEHRALIRRPWKYIHHYRDGSGELYELASDPQERRNRMDDQAPRADEMRRALEAWTARIQPRWSTPRTSTLREDQALQLRALGYTASQ